MTKQKTASTEDRELFRHSVGPVSRIRDDRVVHKKSTRVAVVQKPALVSRVMPVPVQLPEVGTSDVLFYKQPGIQQRILEKLKRGQIAVEKELDLHGMTRIMTTQTLASFLQVCAAEGIRCIRIIHGKGHGSTDKRPVIKNLLNQQLRANPDVLAFCSARNDDGGTGALYAWLRKSATEARHDR